MSDPPANGDTRGMSDTADVDRGRGCYAEGRWREAFEHLGAADRATGLGPDDLELLGRAAYLLGRDDEYVDALERAHESWVAADEAPRAARCAFWIGHSLLFRGRGPRAQGWFSVGRRLLGEGHDCAEVGYLLIPDWLHHMGSDDWESGLAATTRAAEIGERFADADLLWLARDDQARALLNLGRSAEARRLLDEALVIVESGALSAVVRGIVYCNTIAFCRDVFELQHAREWTESLAAWCDGLPQMVAHNGLCRVHRAEVMQYAGNWAGALGEAREARERFPDGMLNQIATGQALYRQGEIHRLQGGAEEAERLFREANDHGYDPQPGLALVRLAQGRTDVAASMLRRAVAEHPRELERAALLPAYVTVMLAIDDADTAAAASRQLQEIADRQSSDLLAALATEAEAAVLLTVGDHPAALTAARRAAQTWQSLSAPYDLARARVLVGRALHHLGDEESSSMELAAARTAFETLGAATDVAGLDAPTAGTADTSGLSPRELEVLRHLAHGASNREIAAALVISEHTVARHVQNIFAKLGVGSRTAAGAYAFEHRLL